MSKSLKPTSGFRILHHLPELAQTHVHWVSDAIQASHPLSPPSPPALTLSQHQGLFRWVGSLHQVAILELQLQHQSFQWIFRVDFCMSLSILDTSCKWNHAVFVCLWLISLFIISFRFTHVITCGRISFFLMLTNILLYVYTTQFYPFIPGWISSLFPYLGSHE